MGLPWIVVAACFGLLVLGRCKLEIGILSSSSKEEAVPYDDESFTKGQIQYLSMDAGMSRCWNSTVKKLVHLSCPFIANNPELQIELAFILTSCFCMSIGAPRLTCRTRSSRDTDEYYHFSLIDCATGKCFNKYDVDGFEINHSVIDDICVYLLDKTQPLQKETIQYIEDAELEILNKVVGGEHYTEFDTRLDILLGIVNGELQKRRNGVMFWITQWAGEFWLVIDDIKFKLRIGKYKDVPYY